MTDQLHDARPRAVPPPSHEARNRLGQAALAFGVVGAFAGAIAFLFPIAAVAGAVATALGIGAVRRVRRGEATNGRTAVAALMLGVLAVLFAAVGFLVVVVASDEIAPPSETASTAF